ncbi:MAG: toxin TcdB middle/N-terminal domain-containing protein [Polyangiaceae bacterium]
MTFRRGLETIGGRRIHSGLDVVRRRAAPIAGVVLFFFAETLIAPAMAWARPNDRAAAQNHEQSRVSAATDSDPLPQPKTDPTPEPQASDSHATPSTGAKSAASAKQSHDDKKSAAPSGSLPPPTLNQALALPTGADKSGVTSKAISLPQGSGKIQGMGESFSAQLSTGIATFSVPFSLPHARGGAQPSLGLSYSSGGGVGLAGMGWDVGVPFISRQTDRGLPSYDDRAGFHPNQDRFVFNGGQELVPICVVTGGVCAGALAGEQMPAWSEGAQYFRPRVEGSFLRFFWSSDHRTWRVQDKSGVTMELGVPLDGSNDTSALDVNPSNSEQIFRWHLARQYDTQGTANPTAPVTSPTPFNVVVYRYFQDGGVAYLADIYDTTPATSPASTSPSLFAHHTRLKYELRSDPTSSYRSGWRMDQTLRLLRVDVASKTFNGHVNDARHQVRRYHLSYETGKHISTLASVQVEGRCQGSEAQAPAEASGPADAGAPTNRTTEALPESTSCEVLPAMTFGYSHVTTNADLPGYDGFNHDLRTIATSPEHSVDEELTDLFDINSDGLPDVLNTEVGSYGYGHGVFFNSAGGTADSFGAAQLMTVQGVLGANANTITFRNLNVSPLDLDGDGSVNLLHMPQVNTYSAYTPVFANGTWSWVGRVVNTASGQSPKIDFGKDTLNTKVLDVNGDGLVDLVVSTGTEYETFFALGRLPQGDAQFGHGSLSTPSAGLLSNDPVRACVPWSATPVQLSDPDVQLADMNGDGLADIVRVRRGDIRYWPGRGDGVWGIGDRGACKPGTFSSNGFVLMGGPQYTDIQGTTLRMDDVNGDGLDDLVQVNYDSISIWLNIDGKAWTDRHIIPNTPKSPSYANRVRLVDVNGSGTRDILWANAKNYQYIDLEGGKKSFLLTHVENGLGKSTDIDYSTSTAEMLGAESLRKCDPATDAALLATSPWGCAWTMKMPMVAHVVKRVTESDNLSVAGSGFGKYVTEYQYRDPLFEGRQREFRGFTRARSHRIGDANSPGDYTESAFLLGECEDETPSDGVDNCSLGERWRDNPREALKGLPIFTEKYDERGVFLSTDSSNYRLRQLYVGMDGRVVRQAFESSKQTSLYDTAAGPQTAATAPTGTVVDLQLAPPTNWDPITNERAHPAVHLPEGNTVPTRSAPIPFRGGAGTATTSSLSEVDFFGNKLVALDNGCTASSVCAADETIAQITKPELISANVGNWLWRTTESWATGSVHSTVQRKHTFISYDAFGSPTLTSAELKGTAELFRFTTVPVNQFAPLPASRAQNSADGAPIPVSVSHYDELGLLTHEFAPNSADVTLHADNASCRQVSYGNDPYSEFATAETIFIGATSFTDGKCADAENSDGGKVTSLTTAASYDRGLGAPTVVTDMQLHSTSVDYDSFGRLSQLTRPSADGTTPKPSVMVSYTLPSAANPVKYSVIHTMTQDGATADSTEYLESYSYVDGLGRTRLGLSEADKSSDAHDLGAFIVSGTQLFDAKSAVSRKYIEYFTDADPAHFAVDSVPSSAFDRQRYDAFGRQIQTFDLDGTVTLQSVYHALSSDLYDAADLENGPHQGSYASTRSDGHGRTIATTERIHVSGAIEAREVRTQYLPTGEPENITRVRVGKGDAPVVRWMAYDSLGRMVLNADPNTSTNFSATAPADLSPGTDKLRAWRYAYDYSGQLVGTSDARGCGENFTYDSAGRLTTEDYSPCGGQGPYSPPTWNVTGGLGPSGYEVIYHYDTAPQQPFATGRITRPANYASASASDANGASLNLRGRLVAVWSTGKTQWDSYDDRGRVIQTAVIPALPLNQNSAPSSGGVLYQRYGHRAYYRDFKFDAADREVRATTGSTVAELQGTADSSSPTITSAVTTQYSHRGTVKKVGSTYGDLVTSITRSADGLVGEIIYGDAAGTTTDSDYDMRRRLRNVQTYRGPPNNALWSSPPANYTPVPAPNGPASTFQLVLQDQQLTYDVVGNPTEVHDYRNPVDWPAGSKPVTKKIQYDDLYRATRIDYQAAGGVDAWTSPFASELSGQSDARRAAPGTHVAFDSRPLYQTFGYDWLGNTQSSDDDAHGFYDRSLGTITNDVSGGHPYQLKSATNKAGTATSRSGSVSVAYDEMGNTTRINLERNGACLPAGSPCSSRWDLLYDEVGRLFRAYRVDVTSAALPPITTDLGNVPRRELQFQYDESDERIVKTSLDLNGAQSSTLYPYETLEVRGTDIDPSFYAQGYADTGLSADNEVPYLVAHGVRLARVHFEPAAKGEPRFGSGAAAQQHVLFELGDQLGSTNIVIDKATSELVEASTYQGYGAKESDYRPERWKGYRDDYGFTGKEEDAEFGLVYFGKRFYSPELNRWITADPLAVHAPGSADLNLYAYVNGQALRATDPVGLTPPGNQESTVGNDGQTGSSDATTAAPARAVPAVATSSSMGGTEGASNDPNPSASVSKASEATTQIIPSEAMTSGAHGAPGTTDASRSSVGNIPLPHMVEGAVVALSVVDGAGAAYGLARVGLAVASRGAARAIIPRAIRLFVEREGAAMPAQFLRDDMVIEAGPASIEDVVGEATSDAAGAPKQLAERAGPTGEITTSEVAGKTPAQIDARARQLGLEAKGANPAQGRGSYIDPQTGEQRILSHPNDTKFGPHGHVNDIRGNRIGPGGRNVPPESIPAHLPIKKE